MPTITSCKDLPLEPRLARLAGSQSLGRSLSRLALLCLSPLLASGLQAKPGTMTFPKWHSAAKVTDEARLQVAANHLQGEVSDAPPAYIDGVFTNLPDKDRINPFRMSLRKPAARLIAAAEPTPATYEPGRNNLHGSLVRMAALYKALNP
jgi:hypothetical protein